MQFHFHIAHKTIEVALLPQCVTHCGMRIAVHVEPNPPIGDAVLHVTKTVTETQRPQVGTARRDDIRLREQR